LVEVEAGKVEVLEDELSEKPKVEVEGGVVVGDVLEDALGPSRDSN
jgi:hypothetical protein